MRIRLRTLTPVHIGTGEELAPLDYVALANRNRFYRVTQEQMLRFVTENIGQKEGPTAFARWISDQYRGMREIRDNRALSAMADAINPYAFCEDPEVKKEREFEQYLNEPGNGIFSAPVAIDEFTRRKHSGARAIPLGRVREAIKNGSGRPLLPGSSIKGAIRTAVFYHFLTQHTQSAKVERIVRDQLQDSRPKKERFALPLIHEAFYCSTQDLHSGKVKADDEKMDLFKLVRCTDGHTLGEEQALSLAKINIYLVEKKQSRDRSKSYFEATQQRQTSYAEIISPGAVIQAEIDFDIDFLVQLKPLLKNGAVTAGGQLHWINVEEKVRQLFGLQLSELSPANKEQQKAKVIAHLYDCLKALNQAQLNAHRQWLEHFEQNDNRDQYTSRIKAGFAPVFARDDQKLMHLGYATGFDGMTGLLYFLADEKRKALFKEVMAKFNLGNKPGNKGKYVPNPDRFPKSKRLVELAEVIQPMGWVELFEEGAKMPALETATLRDAVLVGQQEEEPSPPAVPEYYDKPVNYKKPPELDAVVIKPGRPNIVKVYVTPGYSPEMELMGYNNPMEKGTIIKVQTTFNKKVKLVQIAFRGFK